MRDDAAPGPLTPASAPQAPGRLGREEARNIGAWTLDHHGLPGLAQLGKRDPQLPLELDEVAAGKP